jgi:hypothetical protein
MFHTAPYPTKFNSYIYHSPKGPSLFPVPLSLSHSWGNLYQPKSPTYSALNIKPLFCRHTLIRKRSATTRLALHLQGEKDCLEFPLVHCFCYKPILHKEKGWIKNSRYQSSVPPHHMPGDSSMLALTEKQKEMCRLFVQIYSPSPSTY